MFTLFKSAELVSAARNFKSGTYSWEKVPEIAAAFKGEFDLVGVATGGWLWELLGVAVFDALERISSARRSRDEVVALVLADPAFAGKDASSAEVKQEIGARMRAQSVQEPVSPDQVVASSASPTGLSKLVTALAGAGMPLSEAHTYIQHAAQQGPESFSDSLTISAFSSRVNQLRTEQAASAAKSKSITFESNNTIMEYIRQHPDVGGGLTIEAFGATHHTQTDSEAGKDLEARCLAEQNEGGGVCVHSVHLNKVLGGLSLFASVRGPKREHVATIKFEDGLVYEIKGHNNRLVANQLQASEAKKQTMRSAIKSYISKMLTDGVVDGFNPRGEADFANLLHPEEISSALSAGIEDYSAILPSHELSSEQIRTIWDRISSDRSRTTEFAAMAGNKNTPPEIQRQLLKISDNFVHSALARNENLDPEVHDLLAQSPDRLVRHRALAHPLGYQKEIDQEEILKMLGSRDSKVIARAAASPLAPREKLLEFGMNPLADPNIKSNLLINPNLNLETKQAIFDTLPISAQLSTLRSSTYGARSEDIRQLKLPKSARPDGLDGKQLIEFTKHVQSSDGLKLALDSVNADEFVLSYVANSHLLTPEIFYAILEDPRASGNALAAVARSKAATPEMLSTILEDPRVNRFALAAVAGSKAATPEILSAILRDKRANYSVLADVARNKAATPETLSAILRDKRADAGVLADVAGSKAATPEIFYAILNNRGILFEARRKRDALAAVAGNEAATPEILSAILKDTRADDDVLARVARNKAATPEIFYAILKDIRADDYVLANVAGSKAATPEMLSTILEDPRADAAVLAAVARSKAATPEILRAVAERTRSADVKLRVQKRLEEMGKMASERGTFPLFKRSSRQFRLFR